MTPEQAAANSDHVRANLPKTGLFAGMDWHVSPQPFALGEALVADLEFLGRVLLQFNKAANLLYRQSVAGKQPAWVAQWLDQGKPGWLVELQRQPSLKNQWPRVIRPDLMLTDEGFSITELDSVPGGIGLTGWLNKTYSSAPHAGAPVVGGTAGMLEGFASIFGDAAKVHLVVSEESAGYRPEMEWLAARLNETAGGERFTVRDSAFSDFAEGDAVYRFFELFDVANVPSAPKLFERVVAGELKLTPPPRPLFEEKMLLALLWNRNLRPFWRQELGEAFLNRLQKHVPYSWVVDPAPLPPHGAIPELNLTDWQQLKTMSQRERDLILKVSGYSETAWGARGVYLGSDLPTSDWSAAVDTALKEFPRSPHILQRYHKPKSVPASRFDFASRTVVPMQGRVRLCPYYFVQGDGDAARTRLGGVLATICPADKKIIHGMKDAILAPCAA